VLRASDLVTHILPVRAGHGSDENGCAEFCPTSHHISVNGREHVLNFTTAGSEWGCTEQVGACPCLRATTSTNAAPVVEQISQTFMQTGTGQGFRAWRGWVHAGQLLGSCTQPGYAATDGKQLECLGHKRPLDSKAVLSGGRGVMYSCLTGVAGVVVLSGCSAKRAQNARCVRREGSLPVSLHQHLPKNLRGGCASIFVQCRLHSYLWPQVKGTTLAPFT
jgi:hypothetical protein